MAGRGTERVVNMFLAGTGKQEPGMERGKRTRVLELPIERVKPNPGQPRKQFNNEKISELAKSVAEHGILQPIGVRVVADGYEIVFGERRWRAANEVGLKTVPCITIAAEAVDLKTIALVENLHRQDLSVVEKAMAIKELMVQENLSMEKVGKRLGLGKTRVHQLLNILKLPEELLAEFCTADLNEIHARALRMLSKYPEVQKELLQEILAYELTGQMALEWAEKYLNNLPGKSPVTDVVNRSMKRLARLERKWQKLPADERERCIRELSDLKEKIDYLLSST